MAYTPDKHPNGLRLLALDGGGVRGVVALVVLRDIMRRVQMKKELKSEPRPADYFELAGGTSTGGIIGIMLFRLHMTASQAIEEYDMIAKDVFSPKIYGWDITKVFGQTVSGWINNSKTVVQSSRFDDKHLESAINRVVAKYGLDENDKKLRGNALLRHPKAGKMFVCATAQNRAETVLMRSYKDTNPTVSSKANNIMSKHQDEITISLATRATSAAPTYFPQVPFPTADTPLRDQLIFWDGGLLNNNPVDQLWTARYTLVAPDDPEPEISCVISLGTGYTPAGSPGDSYFQLLGTASAVMDFATNVNPKGKDFSRHMTTLNQRGHYAKTKYLRFNPPLEKEKIGLADYTRMADLKRIAEKDVQKPGKAQEFLEMAVAAICS